MRKLLIILVLVFGLLNQLACQIATNSPYSRFGLGEIQNNSLPHFSALGGASTALIFSRSINPNNPASYSSFAPNSFLLSTGGWHQTTELQNTSTSQTVNNNSFSHVVMGFPLNRKFSASFGMIPFTSTGYEIDSYEQAYSAEMRYYGDGGISKIYFGGAYELLDGFSIGINASYLFGGLNQRKQLIYSDPSFLNSRSNSKINLKGYYYEFGVLYTKGLNKNDEFSIGVTAHNTSSIRAKKNELVESFQYSGFLEVPKDTFVNSVEWGEVVLPQYFSTGISYNIDRKWLFAADYSIQDWSQYSMFNQSDNLANSMKLCGGVQYTPEYNSITKYYKRIDYRIGGTYNNTPLQFGDNQLKEISLCFGFGIPVRKSRTKYDFSFTLGQRGTTEDNLIQENFFRLGLSVSYDGIWFVKRKYD